MKPTITIIGSGEAFNTGLGNTAYLFVGTGFPTVLFDCGYQVPERLWKHKPYPDLDAICFTHLHADHSFGIVPLLARFWEEQRVKPLALIGPRGTERFIRKLLDLGYPGLRRKLNFPLQFKTLSPTRPIKLQGPTLRCAPSLHSILNYAIRVDLSDRRSQSFAISGDGQITKQTRSLVSGVDVLFQEVYSLRPVTSTHCDFVTLRKWMKSSPVKKIVASHFSRGQRTQIIRAIQSLRDSRWRIAKPGLKIRVSVS